MFHWFRYISFLLWPLSQIYRLIMDLRNFLYDHSILKITKLPIPVIAVGNITLGGTGKTPLVIALSSFLESKGFKVGVVTRGYRRKSKGQVVVKDGKAVLALPPDAGDEPYLIACKSGNIVVIADANRVEAARSAIKKYHCNVLIADDAFQHRALARNIDIVLWDSYSNPAKAAVIPAGRLRESWRGLRRADILLITRSAEISDPIRSFFQKKQPDLFIDVLPLSIGKIIHYNSGEEIAPEMIRNKKVLGFCGLGNPVQFFNTIGYLNPASITENIFPDHHKYSEGDVDNLVRESVEKGCDYLITTEKDAMNFPASVKTITNLLILQISSDLSKKIKAAIIQKLPPVSDKFIG